MHGFTAGSVHLRQRESFSIGGLRTNRGTTEMLIVLLARRRISNAAPDAPSAPTAQHFSGFCIDGLGEAQKNRKGVETKQIIPRAIETCVQYRSACEAS